jgi:hypothetical protein
MHSFVAAILLRMTRLDALNANAEAQPPDGKFAEVEQSMGRRKRDTIVAADVGGQATFLKKSLKDGESVVFPNGRERFASEQKTTGVIGDGEGITVLAIAQQELAFVIGRFISGKVCPSARMIRWTAPTAKPERTLRGFQKLACPFDCG